MKLHWKQEYFHYSIEADMPFCASDCADKRGEYYAEKYFSEIPKKR